MAPSPIPRWDVPKLHMAPHLTILSAGCEKRIFAVPLFTRVEPLVFDGVPYKVEDHGDLICHRSGARGFFMNEIPSPDGSSAHALCQASWHCLSEPAPWPVDGSYQLGPCSRTSVGGRGTPLW
ncbi:alpha-D-ribose 1-methylphosphonate 5-phosphate C-P-lyase PhnJ [Sulfitobacter pontiacus]|uniref:alpha-D-ribose 1-methylphosphonate 5-phosphate C-P-lyase PhnJ n=1 Tax=Sulfitobacter pontiacus TaxID=60137 RepID=UPI003299A2AE